MFYIATKDGLPDKILDTAKKVLTDLGFSRYRADLWDRILVLAAIILIAYLSYIFFSKVVIKLIRYLISHSRLNVDRFLFERKFFHHLFGLIPPIIILFLLPLSFDTSYSKLLNIFDKAINIYLIFIFSRILISLIEAGFDYYLMRHDMATSPYKGAVEMARLFINCIMILTIVGVLMNLKLSNVLTGLSAFAAVLVLIFKDTLLGFIAGMQLAQNKMVKIGDWITVPNTNANGVVIEVNILTVRVQNFDNTLVYVPSYTLVTGSFQNWCGMVESGVRRISKSIYIDVTTIKAIQPEEVDTLDRKSVV